MFVTLTSGQMKVFTAQLNPELVVNRVEERILKQRVTHNAATERLLRCGLKGGVGGGGGGGLLRGADNARRRNYI
jgi:hypothetical protein